MWQDGEEGRTAKKKRGGAGGGEGELTGFSPIVICGELEWEPGVCEGEIRRGAYAYVSMSQHTQGVRAGALRGVVMS